MACGDGGEPVSGRGPVLFYSAWPLGYHNVEAERKANALAAAGFDVVYVAGAGVRNPRLVTVPKVLDRLGRRVVSRRDSAVGLRAATLLVVPPRQVQAVRRLNSAWVGRQLRAAVPDWASALAWVRWPTPELVDALTRDRPAALVYESVDAYHLLHEWTSPWLAIHERAERALVSMADVVVVPGEVLAERYRAMGADVRIVPHGADLFDWSPPRADRSAAVIAFVGTLDYRLDVAVITAIATAHPEWRVRLIGPVQRGFQDGALRRLPNVTIEPPVPNPALGQVLAEVDAVITPYSQDNVGPWLTPVKALEALAAGRPLVSRPLQALLPYGDVVSLADTPEAFVATLERVLAEDSPAEAQRRRSVAEANAWASRLEQVVAIADEVLASRGRSDDKVPEHG